VLATAGFVDVEAGACVEDAELVAVELELAYMDDVEDADVIVTVVEEALECRARTLLELELGLGLDLEPVRPLEGELAASVGFRGMVAMMLGIGSIAKRALELLQQARLPGPPFPVSQQLG
jgi:hypothetical protein